jgi:integrase
LELGKEKGVVVRSVAERMRAALKNVGARRGLEDRTIDCYGSWVVRYGQWAGTAKRAMDPAVGRDFLSYQVEVKEVAQSTQKQCLCALVFFFKDICGMEKVDLGIKFRKTTPRAPVVLDVDELVDLIGKLTSTWTLAAQLQYGSGMRRAEVMSLRIKDVDTKRRTITVQKGKGDKDRVTVFPEGLVKAFEMHKAAVRQVFDADRAAGRPGFLL